ncbi:MAG TPA: FAD:protein FMN transferase [Solirubrobacterales bacterium]|jgi:thiamine biosynthesis lipoprotein|nr:FAD:protein FMN transferase [Solirubrobacterales bacterium]
MSKEAVETFECFGGRCAVRIGHPDGAAAGEAARNARLALLDAHRVLSRFDPDSELSRLNRDPRREVPASPLLRRVVAAALTAGLRSGGLVDATLVDEIEAAGYTESRDFGADPGRPSAAGAPHPAAPSARAGWCELVVDARAGTVKRPPGLRLDPGGIAKGLMADLVGESLADFDSFAVDCCGDLRVGGTAARPRAILVDDPAGGEPLHELRIADGAVATSGITRRVWTDRNGLPAHQILDPANGLPAFTGIVQATAVAPTGLLAETLAKSALLVGPERADSQLPFGGVIVEATGALRIVESPASPPAEVAAA